VIYQFSDYCLDTEAFELTSPTGKVSVEPQAFSLLQFLIENNDRVVSKDELIEKVWDGRIVSDAALNSCVNATRRAVGDDGKTQAVIKTFPRRGFRFVADIEASDAVSAPTADTSDAAASGKPSIAVLPFENLSSDQDDDVFADGITEDLITGLSHVRRLMVISRNSSFSYRGQSPDARAAARELGVRFVLEGSVRKSGKRLRVTAQLIDGENGTQIWADRFDRELEDIFAVQDEITSTVVGAVLPELERTLWLRAKRKTADNLDAWDAYHLGLACILRRDNFGDDMKLLEGISNFETAIARDPEFSSAYAGLANCHYLRLRLDHSTDREQELELGFAAAKRALSLDFEDAYAHTVMGSMHHVAGDTRLAIPVLETAIELNPNGLQAYLLTAHALNYLGRGEESIERLQTALRLSPRDPLQGPIFVRMAEAYFAIGDHEASVEWAQKALGRPETQFWGNAILTAALGQLGRQEDAQAAAKKLLDRKPDFTVALPTQTQLISGESDYLKRYEEGLRKAGIPKN
jgi:TolB-like protein/lipopolysaccharide biosynthesis regulator YciM